MRDWRWFSDVTRSRALTRPRAKVWLVYTNRQFFFCPVLWVLGPLDRFWRKQKRFGTPSNRLKQ